MSGIRYTHDQERKYERVLPIGCFCTGRTRTVSSICGCLNPKCNYDEWKCTKCDTKKRYKAWILVHYKHSH